MKMHFRRAISAAVGTLALSYAVLSSAQVGLEKVMIQNRSFARDGLSGWAQSTNNNRAIQIQKDGGMRPGNGEVKLSYYAHMAWMITSPRGMTVMIDPWRNDPSLVWGVWYQQVFPRVSVDVGLSTHAHFDHDNLTGIDAIMLLDRMGGKWEFGDVKITGIVDKHVCRRMGKLLWDKIVKDVEGYDPCPPNNPTQWDNVMYLIETGGLRILHTGDTRPDPAPEAWQKIGNVDVLLVATDDSGHILDHKSADEFCKRTKCKILVPGHYMIPKITIPEATMEPAENFVVKGHPNNFTRLTKPDLVVTPASLKKYNNHVMYFGNVTHIPVWTPPAGSDKYDATVRGNFYQ
jgi:L-ascorbate metabolism protein UlaG (beta-lactamase superfamily)